MSMNSLSAAGAADLSVLYAGHEACAPDHRCGYCVRDHYLLHYIMSGAGVYIVNGTKYFLKKGDGFIIFPSLSTCYKASPVDPWEYCWAGFTGQSTNMLMESAHLSPENPIFHYSRDSYIEECLKKICNSMSTCHSIEYEALGYFYLLFSRLIEQYLLTHKEHLSNSDKNVEKAMKYIQRNYWKNLTIEEVSRYIGLDRTQLFRLFKLGTALSPQQYLINYRIAKARELIAATDLNFEEIAHSVGFEYTSYFFRIFKKHEGLTPSEFRMNALKQKQRKIQQL